MPFVKLPAVPVAIARRKRLSKFLSDLHVNLYRWTNGVIGGNIGGTPMMLLTTKGRKSGRTRTVPLLYMRDDKSFVVIGSSGGSDSDPAWWLNLKTSPDASVQAGREKVKVAAREADGEERETLWSKITEIYPGYNEYQTRTDRKIPVVVLSPA